MTPDTVIPCRVSRTARVQNLIRPYSNLAIACTGILGVLVATGGADSKSSKKDPALERTRKQVRMLDDIYKTAY